MQTTERQRPAEAGCTPDGGCVGIEHPSARMVHPAMMVPGAMAGLQGVAEAVAGSSLPARVVDLVNVRASQINGCGVCLLGDIRGAKKRGETDERIHVVAGWRDAPFFDDAERAALALTEAVTRLADRADPVPDEVWNEAARHFDDEALGALVLAIANINVWNRLNVATRQVAGAHEW